MSIIIPSKNIFGGIESEKVVANQINTVELSLNNIYVEETTKGVLTLPKIEAFTTNGSGDFYEPNTSASEYDGVKIKNIKYTNGVVYYNQLVEFSIKVDIGTNKTNLFENITISLQHNTADLKGNRVSREENFTYKSGQTLSTGKFVVIPVTDNMGVVGLGFKQMVIYYKNKSINEISGWVCYSVGTNSTVIGGQSFDKTLETRLSFYIRNELLSKIETVKVGSTNNSISITNNELLQFKNTIDDDVYYEYFANKIIESWGKGKETATIRCSISDYYDYDSGDKIIAIDNSTKKMCFDIGDKVIPMIYGADGKDRPMSLKKDGKPKIFRVLGIKPYYDGAVWQEISLQEV